MNCLAGKCPIVKCLTVKNVTLFCKDTFLKLLSLSVYFSQELFSLGEQFAARIDFKLWITVVPEPGRRGNVVSCLCRVGETLWSVSVRISLSVQAERAWWLLWSQAVRGQAAQADQTVPRLQRRRQGSLCPVGCRISPRSRSRNQSKQRLLPNPRRPAAVYIRSIDTTGIF